MINKVDGNNYNVYTKQKKIEVPDAGEKFSLGYQKNESSSNAKDKTNISGQEKQQSLERSGVRLDLSAGGQAADADRRRQAEAGTAKTQSASQQTPLLEVIRTYIMAAFTAVREFFHTIWNDQPQETVSQDSRPLDGQLLLEGDSQDTQIMEGDSQDTQIMEGDSQDTRLMEGDSQDTQLMEGDSQDAQFIEGILQDDQLVEGVPSSDNILQNASSEILQEPEEIIDASDEISVRALEEERRNREIQQSLRDGDMEHVINLLTDNGKKTIAKNSTLLTSYDKNGRVVEPSASDRERALYGDRNTWKL